MDETAVAAETDQYLTFKLDTETYAVNVIHVQGILEWMRITRLPRASEIMRGVVNVRGNVVPLMDLRLKFGMTKTEQGRDTCIINMEVVVNDEKLVIGVLADAVEEVIELDESHIDPTPRIGTRIDTEFIKGIGKRDDGFIIILNVERIFSQQEMDMMQEASAVSVPQEEAVVAATADK